jgi:hypothetical protein
MFRAIFGLACIIGTELIVMATPSCAAIYDKTVKVETLTSPQFSQIRCTYYSDIMVLETETDQTGPGPATLLSGLPDNLQCNDKQTLLGLKLATQSFTYEGRRGAFLIFTATDPNGATPFMIINTTGHLLYSDAVWIPGFGEDFQTVDALPDGGVHLQFTRGINASCSVLGDATCWRKLGKDGSLPKVVSHLAPPTGACHASYVKGKVPSSDPSIIFYKVDMSLSATGKAHVNSRGALGCDPLP